MHEPEGKDEDVQEQEDEEEDTATALVDHPVADLLRHRARHVGRDGLGGGGVGALEPLEAAALGLVALEVARTISADDDVGVLLERGDLAV